MLIYPKIQSIFKRNENTHKFIMGEYSLPEFEYLANNEWVFTEKIDGTNIRIGWGPSPMAGISGHVNIAGRGDKSQIAPFLVEKLKELFEPEKLREIFRDSVNVCLYGEGYGAKIQKGGGKYIPDGVGFILFDILINNWWLKLEDMKGIAAKLGIAVVPVIGRGTLAEAIELVQAGIMSKFGAFEAEGLVLKPTTELRTRSGNRIITKIKHKDF